MHSGTPPLENQIRPLRGSKQTTNATAPPGRIMPGGRCAKSGHRNPPAPIGVHGSCQGSKASPSNEKPCLRGSPDGVSRILTIPDLGTGRRAGELENGARHVREHRGKLTGLSCSPRWGRFFVWGDPAEQPDSVAGGNLRSGEREGEQARTEQDQAGDRHGEEAVGSEFTTHGPRPE